MIQPHREAAKPFLILSGGSAISFAAFDQLCARVAGLLAARGILPGDRVAVKAPKKHPHHYAFVAELRATQ